MAVVSTLRIKSPEAVSTLRIKSPEDRLNTLHMFYIQGPKKGVLVLVCQFCVLLYLLFLFLYFTSREQKRNEISISISSSCIRFTLHFHKSIKDFPLHNHKQHKLRIVVNKQPPKRRTLCGFCIL